MSLYRERDKPSSNVENETLVLAHGFTQNRNCWGPLAGLLAADHQTIRVDLPGHGLSGHDDATLELSADLLAEAGGQATYVGYSLGGRIGLHLALSQPHLVRRLVLIGTNPGILDPDERTERAGRDAELAAKLVEVGLKQFLRGWLSAQLFEGLSTEAAALAERYTNRVDGLVSSLNVRSVGRQQPLWENLFDLKMPVLLIAGESDVKYRAINEEMSCALPCSSSVVVPGSHAAHLQQPEAVSESILRFCEET